MSSQNTAPPETPQGRLSQIPGAEVSGRLDAWWGLLIGVVVLLVLLVATQPDPYLRLFLFVLDGIYYTLLTTVVSFLLVLVVGMIGGLARLAHNKLIYGAATLYVEIIRGIPLLVQLMFWYYALPTILQNIGNSLNIEWLADFQAHPVGMAILGLTICYGAYMSEVYRAGIQSIPKGQYEAARSQGMTYVQAMRYVILPQAFRVILPPVGNEFISLLKDSSLISVLAVTDLTRRGREFMSANFVPVETWVMVGLLYLVMTLFSARIVARIERVTKVDKR